MAQTPTFDPCLFKSNSRIRHDHRWHKTGSMTRSAFRLRAQRSSPIQQKRARDAVAPRRRRNRPRALHALQNNLELLVIRPASTSAGFNNSEPFNLSTVLIAVHKDCYTALILTRQGGLHRRKTAIRPCHERGTHPPGRRALLNERSSAGFDLCFRNDLFGLLNGLGVHVRPILSDWINCDRHPDSATAPS